MNCYEAVETVLSGLKEDDICLFTTGFISRIGFSVREKKTNFYMLGSMGLVSSVGLGIAINTGKRVFIFDGDGSVLMDMGSMAMIGARKPENLFHIVLDNEAYESTGCQPTLSSKVSLNKLALDCGYAYSANVSSRSQLKRTMDAVFDKKGPVFVLVKACDRINKVPGRVDIAPVNLTRRIKSSIKNNSGL